MLFPSTAQVTLPAAFIGGVSRPLRSAFQGLLSSSFFQCSAKRTLDEDTDGFSSVPSFQPPAKRRKRQAGLDAILRTVQEAYVPLLPIFNPISLLDLPNEIIDLVLNSLADADLLTMALQLNSRLRTLAARIYLIRLGIIESNGRIALKENVPPIAMVLLATIPLFDDISLTCDLFYLVEYEKHVRRLVATTPRVRSVCIQFHEDEKALLHDARTSVSLITTLATLRDTCFCLRIQRSLIEPPKRSLTIRAARPTRRLCRLPNRGFALLSVSADFARIPSLFEACKAIFLASSQIDDFQVEDCRTQQDCDNILSIANFANLARLTIRSYTNVTFSVNPGFFRRHSQIESLFLFTHPIEGRPLTAPRSTLSLPRLTHLYFSANYHLLKFKDATRLRQCFIQAPNSSPNPTHGAFCSNVNTLAATLGTLAKHDFQELKLIIRLPERLSDHVNHFVEHSEEFCACGRPTDLRLPGVKTIEFMVDSFDYSTSDRLLDWVRICPNAQELHITPQWHIRDFTGTLINDHETCNFVSTCGVALRELNAMYCPAGVWKRYSQLWVKER